MNARLLAVLSSLTLCLAASRAEAQQDAVLENVVVRNRLFSVKNRLEASVSAGANVTTRLTAHYVFDAGLAYNLLESLAIEGRAGYAASRHTGLADSVAEQYLSQRSENTQAVDELSDLWEMGAHVVGGLRWAPVYGKLSLLEELPVHFQSYLWLGGGMARLSRESLLVCTQVVDRARGICDNRTVPEDRSSATETYWAKDSRTAPVVSAAWGLRFFVGQHHGVRLELRDWVFRDSYRVNLERALYEAGQETGTFEPHPGLQHIVQFDLGYTFLF
ncbi:outer membrane beta-barrel domain-containing protein [Aggregicoccus sp. 17bor-14]|uniref:outer membrane beta-barrel domain-containing protein n=1 Tax=Myxococcaceae TaxID=31 RepID=UPI00129CBDD5|nr:MULTISPECIES: outer membrane beta-barrel domain-containing protein [Myxococcaceae]MBF5044031.1 outer membrane beta-barrel domain-containing protein [Simulacricoccus sp. 17bor-14]MRI89782.1 outer membrane beta-barrel domain-containing protein [Aggregicoccus sp. 17bor-14]